MSSQGMTSLKLVMLISYLQIIFNLYGNALSKYTRMKLDIIATGGKKASFFFHNGSKAAKRPQESCLQWPAQFLPLPFVFVRGSMSDPSRAWPLTSPWTTPLRYPRNPSYCELEEGTAMGWRLMRSSSGKQGRDPYRHAPGQGLPLPSPFFSSVRSPSLEARRLFHYPWCMATVLSSLFFATHTYSLTVIAVGEQPLLWIIWFMWAFCYCGERTSATCASLGCSPVITPANWICGCWCAPSDRSMCWFACTLGDVDVTVSPPGNLGSMEGSLYPTFSPVRIHCWE